MPTPANHPSTQSVPASVMDELMQIASVPAENRALFDANIRFVASGEWEWARRRSQMRNVLGELLSVSDLMEHLWSLDARGYDKLLATSAYARALTTVTNLAVELGHQPCDAHISCDTLVADLDRARHRVDLLVKHRSDEQVPIDTTRAIINSLSLARSSVAVNRGPHRPKYNIGDPDYPASDLFVALAYASATGQARGTLSINKNATGQKYPYGTLPVFLRALSPYAPRWVDIPEPPEKLGALVGATRKVKALRARHHIIGQLLS